MRPGVASIHCCSGSKNILMCGYERNVCYSDGYLVEPSSCDQSGQGAPGIATDHRTAHICQPQSKTCHGTGEITAQQMLGLAMVTDQSDISAIQSTFLDLSRLSQSGSSTAIAPSSRRELTTPTTCQSPCSVLPSNRRMNSVKH